MIGDDSAPTYFSVGKEQGEIKLRSGVNLKSDTETTYIVSRCNRLIFGLPELKMYLDWKITQQNKIYYIHVFAVAILTYWYNLLIQVRLL